MVSIDDVIRMKEIHSPPFANRYIWLILFIEDCLMGKSNGEEQVKSFLNDYDNKAKVFIVHQFMKFNIESAHTLLELFEIKSEDTFLEDEYINELVTDYF